MKKASVLSSYFHLSKKERMGILVIIVLIAGLFLLTPVYRSSPSSTIHTDTSWMRELQSQEIASPHSRPKRGYPERYERKYASPSHHANKRATLFYFDPNTLDKAGWIQLGLREKTVLTILNFRSKGGRFRTPEDLKKIYGLFPDEFDRIVPYIQIQTGIAQPSSHPGEKTPGKYKATFGPVDINLGDTSDFMALPGIGSKLASRILAFREKLGGFYSIDQVAETYGLPDSVFKKIRGYFIKGDLKLRKLNINTAALDELKAHPYIRYALANPIIAYRNAHGPFQKAEDLKNIMAISNEIFEKIAPYLEL